MEPCGTCQSCRLGAAGNHPDLHQIGLPEGKRTLPIELLLGDRNHRNREGLCHDIAMRPLLGRRRVALIDDADCFSLESANCLLKTLEEPPPGSVLFLIGTSRSRQLPTILSRSQIVRFAPLPRDQLAQVLLQQSLAENLDEALLLADRCDGTLEGASELADPELRAKQAQFLAQFTPERFESTRLAAELTTLINEAGKEASARRQRLRTLLQLVACPASLLRYNPRRRPLRTLRPAGSQLATSGRRHPAMRPGRLGSLPRGRGPTRSQRQPIDATGMLARRLGNLSSPPKISIRRLMP